MFLRSLLRLRTAVNYSKGTHVAVCCKQPQGLQRLQLSTTNLVCGVWEPDDLRTGPEIPEYESIHVRMRGHDYAVLESFAKYVHRLTDTYGIDSDSWASPGTNSHVKMFKKNSTVVENTYDIKTHERTLQLQGVPSTILPLFLEAVKLQMPEGVEVTLKEPDPEEEENRYIPDKQLIGLQSELQLMQEQREEKRRK